MDIDPNDIFHVYPKNDLQDHNLSHYLDGVIPIEGSRYCPCKCNPECKQENNSLIIVHNSFDGREGVEWANEILYTR